MHITHVKQYPRWAMLLDNILRPVMAFGQITNFKIVFRAIATFSWPESVQRTHPWNNKALKPAEVACLAPELLFMQEGLDDAVARGHDRNPIFHLPMFGGWTEQVVLQPQHHTEGETWYVGWCTPYEVKVSEIPLSGPVKMLIGPDDVEFFAINQLGDQLAMMSLGRRSLGSEDQYAKIPLL